MSCSISIEGKTLTFSPMHQKKALPRAYAIAKQHERLLVLNAYRKALIAEFERLNIPYGLKDEPLQHFSTVIFGAAPDKNAYKKVTLEKVKRFCKKAHFSLEESILHEPILQGKISELKNIIEKQGYTVSEEYTAFVEELISFEEKKIAQDYYRLGKKVITLASYLLHHGSLRKKNQKVLQLLRWCLEHPLYRLLKEEESHPIVHFLHGLALSSLLSANVVEAFLPLAEKIGAITSQGIHNTSFSAFLRTSREMAHKYGLFKNDRTLRYAIHHGKYLVGAFLSMKLGRLFAKIKKYDPRGHLENNPGAFFEQKFVIGEMRCIGRTIYTPSPTIGETIAPETCATLQALENRFFMSPRERGQEKFPYVFWSYTNLQNSASSHEGKRSQALMKLQRLYPFSFFSCTIAQDSPMYKGGIGGRNEERIAQFIYEREHAALDESYKEALFHEITHADNFDPSGLNRGYYFPVKNVQEKEELEKYFRYIIDAAYAITSSMQQNQPGWNWYQKTAFRELVFLGMIVTLQAWNMKRISCGDQFRVIFTQACKENVDRGGKTNAELFWALSDSSEEHMKIVLAALHGRALLGRARLIHPHRVEPMYALTLLPHEKVRAFLEKAIVHVGVTLVATNPIF